MKISEVENMYGLRNLRQSLDNYFGKGKLLLDCWNRVRMQMRSVLQPGTVLEPAVVLASPPSKEYRRGRCNFVLVKGAAKLGFAGINGTV